jgi:hypothetical protein
MVVAVVALVVALTGSAYAAATNFVLNTSNTGTATTGLNASSVNGKALQLTNTNTGSNATALGLSVAGGHQPFTVNSNAKVANLNASLLGGIGAGGFVQGKGTSYGNAVAIAFGGELDLAVSPGFASLKLSCTTVNNSPTTLVTLVNASSVVENFFDDFGDFGTFGPGVGPGRFGAGDAGELFTFSVQGDINNVQTVAVITVGNVYRRDSNDCHFQVQAITTHQ